MQIYFGGISFTMIYNFSSEVLAESYTNDVIYNENYDYAKASIDLALGRGGDQAVVKENNEIKHVPINYLIGKVKTFDFRESYYNFKELLESELNSEKHEDFNYILNDSKILKYHIDNSCYSIPHCPICGKKLTNRFRNKKYYITCSTKCAREFNKKYSNDLNPNYNGIKILTNNGFEKFDGISVSNSTQQYQIEFENGSTIVCSPNHKFIVDGQLLRAEQLNVGDNIFTIKHLTRIKSINVVKSKLHLYDIINSGN